MFGRVSDPEVRQLRRHLAALRRRIWQERVAELATRALAVGFGLALLVAVAAWAMATPLEPAYYAGPVAAALGLGMFLSLFRYPSAMEAARSADRRLGLRERVGTAVELTRPSGRSALVGPFGRRQLGTAIDAAEWARRHWQREVRTGRPLALAATLGLLTAGVILLTGLEERLQMPIPRPSIWSLLPQQEPAAEVPAEPAPVEAAPRAETARPPGEGGGRTGAVAQSLDDIRRGRESGALSPQDAANRLSRAETELSRQTESSRTQREALDRLGRALDQVAAGRPASEAIQRGEYDRAGQEITSLGTESDQLSAQAKAQLAQALRSAAAESAASPELAAKERRAADALAGRDYEATRRALEELGEEVARRGRDVVPQQELARAWDQVNQERQAQGQPPSTAGRQDRSGQGQGQRSAQGGAAQAPRDAAAGQGAGSGAGTEPGGDGGGEGASGDGQGSGGQPDGRPGSAAPSNQPGSEFQVGGQAPRLEIQGRPVEVDVKPGQRNGRREGEGNADANQEQTDEVGAISTVTGDAPRSITSAAPAESNFVPSDRREVVRGYFTGQTPGQGN